MTQGLTRFADAPPQAFAELFDEGSGRLDPRIYTDADLYELELARVFSRSWLFIAHESQLKAPGDFITTYMAEDPVIAARQADGGVKVFLNQCRHRGMRLCRADSGNAKSFVCVYHGWAYDTAGGLRSMPHEQAAYGRIDKSEWGARQVPRVESHRGLIFANWDAGAPALLDYLGDIAFYLDAALDRSPGGMEVYGEPIKWVIPGNWKLAAEQSCSDLYHGMTTHVSFNGAAGQTPGPPPPAHQYHHQSAGHGAGFIKGGPAARMGFHVGLAGGDLAPGFDPGEEAAEIERAAARLGEPRAALSVQHNVVFPNFALFDGACNLRIWHPRGPGEVEFWSIGLVPADATPAMKEQIRLANIRALGPSGVLEEDDGENWVEIQRVLRGYQARHTPMTAQMGLHRPSGGDPAFPGGGDYGFSEAAARGFYARWLELVSDTPRPTALHEAAE